MKSNLTIVIRPLAALVALAALAIAAPAAAHHPMGGATPATLLEGLLSGFGHPIIGFDHLLFILAVGVACYCCGRRIATIAVFLLSALAGTLLHLRVPGVPYAEAWVAASLVLLGLLFFRNSDLLKRRTAIALYALRHGARLCLRRGDRRRGGHAAARLPERVHAGAIRHSAVRLRHRALCRGQKTGV